MYTEQLPPHDDEAEEAVLGSLLIDNDEIPHVSMTLGVDDFWGQKHGWVYGAILTLYNRGDAVNQISTADELNRTGRLEDCGGLVFLSHLITTVPTSVYSRNYAKVVKGKSLQRQLIKFGSTVAEIGETTGLGHVPAQRRLSDLKNQGRIVQGPPRQWHGRSQVTWLPVEEQGRLI